MEIQEYFNCNVDSFLCRSQSVVAIKLQRFHDAGPESVHAIFDFDHTITAAIRPGEDISSWDILDSHLPTEGKASEADLYRKYRALEVKGNLTEDDANEWWSQSLDLYVKHGANVHDIKQTFIEIAKLRTGIAELTTLYGQLDIPIIILSAGVREVIEAINEHHGIAPSQLIATKLHYTPDGRITGWDRSTLVHSRNKLSWSHKELTGYRDKRPLTILVGDSLEDANMAEGDENVLRIRIHDPRTDEHDDQATFARKSFAAGFDLIIGPDLTPLVQLCKQLFEQAEEVI